jgi:predicted methyltransferase
MISARFLPLLFVLACGDSLPPDVKTTTTMQSDEAAIRSAAATPFRTEANKKRDVYRHPVETLAFFGVKPDMNVVEMYPGGGWYTEILAPLLRERGKLTVTTIDTSSYTGGPQDKPGVKGAHDLAERFKTQPDVFGKVTTTLIDPPNSWNLGPDGSADMVLTFRNIHDWVRDGFADKVIAAMYKVLKPGGVLGVEAHRSANATSDPVAVGKSGYLSEAFVISIVEKAGFKLEGKSDVNANAKDVHQYPEGVWTLPPTLRLGDKNRDLYTTIGESDRMTLRFVKPGKP